ncbi:MAG: tetraacyldisaccharide 4'-kinase [Gemmatimonadaceae bacterium]
MSRAIERIWERDGAAARALTPLSWFFGALVAMRNGAYEAGLARRYSLGLPTVSVGNLTVGGTGKTPVSAWFAAEMARRGERPAVLLRGYGDDEPLVHARLTPDAIIVADADRVRGAARARAQGATVLVLDDGFQHRRARRDLDVVLVAAEQGGARRMLPAGPLRESRGALRRAQLLIVTRKTASLGAAEAVAADWGGRLPTAILHLAPGALNRWTIDGAAPQLGLTALAGRRVLAFSALGAPAAFEGQLAAAGAVVEAAAYPDHHPFSGEEIAGLANRAATMDYAVCTLKDAVKVGPRWPRNAPPFWYLSQAVNVERGERILADRLDHLTTDISP